MSDGKRPPGVVNFCHQCGQAVPEGAAVCPNCGAPQQQEQSDEKSQGPSGPAPGVPGQPQQPEQPKGPARPRPPVFDNVGFWPRVLASLIDMFVVYALIVPIVAGLVASGTVGRVVELTDLMERSQAQGFLLQMLSVLIGLVRTVYYTIMDGRWGATLGKMALGMKIVRDDGSPISYGIALGRIIIKLILQQCTCSLMYLSVAINDEHRGWHDQIIGTRVIWTR